MTNQRMKLVMLKPRVAKIAASRLAIIQPLWSMPHYRIRGRALQEIRAEHFRDNPLCVHCLARGIVTAAVELDHIIALSNGGTDTPDNRQSLCSACHRAKTIVDLAGRCRGGVSKTL